MPSPSRQPPVLSTTQPTPIGTCPACSDNAGGIFSRWAFRKPELPKTSIVKAIFALKRIEAGYICELCEIMCRHSKVIRGSISPLRRRIETFDVSRGLEGISLRAESGCHVCILLCGMFNMELLKETQRWEALGTGKIAVRIHIASEGNIKFLLLCVGGCAIKEPEKIYTKTLAIRPAPNHDLWLPKSPEFAAQAASYTGSAESITLMSKWILECFLNHRKCNASLIRGVQRDVDPYKDPLPRRTIDVSLSNPSLVQVHIRDDTETDRNYLALSHCWGHVNVLSLTSSTMPALLEGVNLNELPKTYRDAVDLTRRLGIRYLWIDSLCIVQDDPEDWRIESATMGRIYERAFCTIAATWAPDSTNGCYFSRNPRSNVSCSLGGRGIGSDPDVYLYPSGLQRENSEHAFNQIIDSSPLAKRAWVVQERLLSSRIIHFGPNQLLWECRSCTACENWPTMQERARTQIMIPDVTLDAIQALVNEVGATTNPCGGWNPKILETESYWHDIGCFEKQWRDVVQTYTKAQLTYDKDKLVALGGVADIIGFRTGMTYLAGLWSNTLPGGLLWFIQAERKPQRPPQYRAPSWSWASVDGVVDNLSQNFSHRMSRIEVICAETTPAGSGGHATGELVGGSLKIQATLKMASWKEAVQPSDRRRPYHFKRNDQSKSSNVSEYQNAKNTALLLCNEDGNPAGWLLPDTDESIPKGPLTCLRIHVQIPREADEELQARFPPRVRGLALQATGRRPKEYERVGYFELEENFCDPLSWFDGCKAEIVTIV